MATDERAVRAAIRRFLLQECADTLAAVLAAADDVSRGWSGPSTTDRAAVVDALRRALDREGLTAQFPTVLLGAADAAGLSLRAEPVAAPPYVVVASTGPVLRGTAEAGRLVVALEVFDIERGDPVRYRRTASRVEPAVRVEFHPD